MSVESTSNQLAELMTSFQAKRETIRIDPMISDPKKSLDQTDLRGRVLAKAEALAAQLWGQMLTDPETSEITLSEEGEVWSEMAGHEAALAAARDSFQKARFGGDSALASQIAARAGSLVRIAGSQAGWGQTAIERFWALFEAEPLNVQNFLREAGASLVPSGSEWSAVINQLENERQADLDAHLEPTQARVSAFMQQVIVAHKTSGEVANEFARDSDYLSKFLAGVMLERHIAPSGITNTLDRKPIRSAIRINRGKKAPLHFGR